MSFYLENMTLEDNEFYRATLNIEIFTVQIFPFAEINILEISSIWFICKLETSHLKAILLNIFL